MERKVIRVMRKGPDLRSRSASLRMPVASLPICRPERGGRVRSLDITYEIGGETYWAYLDVCDAAAKILTGPDINRINRSAYGIALREYLADEDYLLGGRAMDLTDVILIEIEESNEREEYLNVVNNGSQISYFE